MELTTLRLPLPWSRLGFPDRWQPGPVVLEGSPAWAWSGPAPDVAAETVALVDESGAPGRQRPGWGIDHVVLTVPDIDATVRELQRSGLDLRLRSTIRGRSMAFFRAGPVLEVVEVVGSGPGLYGVALVTELPLAAVASDWREIGFDIGDPHRAVQPNREIFSVRDLGCGLAVMSPDGPRQGASP